MDFDQSLQGIAIVQRTDANPAVSGVEYDSRRVQAGAVFVAMRGEVTDGNRFIDMAIEHGATAIVTDSAAAFAMTVQRHPELGIAQIEHGRRALAAISANVFGHPERKLHLTGVTGTNGKTTTAFLLEAMLRSAKRQCVLVGTIEYHVANNVLPSPHTTPESRDLLQLFADGVALGATEAVMEVSSHALVQGRVWGLHYETAIFTNLTQDHLDYHGDMETYFRAKSLLFSGTGAAPPRSAVIHTEDAYGQRLVKMAQEVGSQVFDYAMHEGSFHAEAIQLAVNGTQFEMVTPFGTKRIHTRLVGMVNVLNLLAASAAAAARGLSMDEILQGIAQMDYVPGRFQTVDCGQPFTVAVDYAHTEDALRNVTRLARALAESHGGRVITLFGCGGDRDRTKRPRMGQAAGEGSDFVVMTSDNPRSENPQAILDEILPGVQATGVPYIVEADRAAAITQAIAEARANDVVILAGKGHEKIQVLENNSIPFDDAEIARTALTELVEHARPAEK
ncbi:MAG TPA: UDP-N-acetylmuramoyl-L-alanyl-D-glutamate--2,6-diaminopimelate ligase [Acidobacteriaceae bacterium]|jgi:UDP-N-acetylmuramoyl-L-alanyl-D-glutamate--2,6-diaminopimelate ligase|nr:UDP-N-acetylmuramoyl-L-alanyl-D-glutamate--2,6-diaminopimelate ligase [Acidobacteriaceae bacterium]